MNLYSTLYAYISILSLKQCCFSEWIVNSYWYYGCVVAVCVGLAVIGLVLAVTVVMFVVYRMRKKDEGSYALDEPKTSPTIGYTKTHDREFFA